MRIAVVPASVAVLLLVTLLCAHRAEAQAAANPDPEPGRAPFSVDLANRSSFSSPHSHWAGASTPPLVVEIADGALCIPTVDAPSLVEAPARDARSPRRQPRNREVVDASVARHIAEASAYYDVDSDLVTCIIRQESGFSRRAVSPKGAAGYMQLMPETARRMGVADVFDARENIWGGVRYLRHLLDLFDDDVALALAGYNAGEGRVLRAGYRVPRIAETIDYVRAITARYRKARHLRPSRLGRDTNGERLKP